MFQNYLNQNNSEKWTDLAFLYSPRIFIDVSLYDNWEDSMIYQHLKKENQNSCHDCTLTIVLGNTSFKYASLEKISSNKDS